MLQPWIPMDYNLRANAHRDDGRRFIVQSHDKLSAFLEPEREVLTVKFYLESVHANSWSMTNDRRLQ